MGASLLNYNSRLTRNAIDGDIKETSRQRHGPWPDCACGCGLHEKAERSTISSASRLFSRDESRMLSVRHDGYTKSTCSYTSCSYCSYFVFNYYVTLAATAA